VESTNIIQRTDFKIHVESALEQFYFDRKAAGTRDATISFYQEKLQAFTKYLEIRSIHYIEQIAPNDLREFLVQLEQAGHNPGGVHSFYRSIRAFLRWCEAEELTMQNWKNPIRKVKAPKVDVAPLAPIPIEDVKKILATCDREFYGHRDSALILTLLDSGMRASEVMALTKDDIDLLRGTIQILKSKNRRPRTAFIGKATRKALRKYLSDRTDDSNDLWVQKNGVKMEYFALRAILTRRCQKAGLDTVWLPHSFRRASALEMLRKGADIVSLQAIGGWHSVEVMKRYLKQNTDDLARVHARVSPVDGL